MRTDPFIESNPYRFVSNDAISKNDQLGLCEVVASGAGTPEDAESGHHTYFGGHNPNRKGHRLKLSVTCPKCTSLTLYSISGNPPPTSYHEGFPAYALPERVFPRDWTTVSLQQHSTLDGTEYDVEINVPTRDWKNDYNSLANVRMSGLCCDLPFRLTRSDPDIPPVWYDETPGESSPVW